MMRTAVLAAFITGIGAFHSAASQPDALTRLREALGGETALSAIRTIRARGTIDRKPDKDNIEIAVVLPDQFLRTVRTFRTSRQPRWTTRDYDMHDISLSRTTAMIVDVYGAGETGIQVSGFNRTVPVRDPGSYGPETPGSAERRLESARARFAEFILPLLGNTSSAYSVEATSEGDTITFRASSDRSWRLELDPATHLPSRMTWTTPVPPQARAGAVPSRWQVDFSDFKIVEGVRWPHRLIKSRNGTVDEDSTVKRYEINLELSDKTFKK